MQLRPGDGLHGRRRRGDRGDHHDVAGGVDGLDLVEDAVLVAAGPCNPMGGQDLADVLHEWVQARGLPPAGSGPVHVSDRAPALCRVGIAANL